MCRGLGSDRSAPGGKTVAPHLRPGPELKKARRVSEYERVRDLVGQMTEVNRGDLRGQARIAARHRRQ
jgi:hypothetical protein